MDWTDLAQEREKRRVLVNTVMNLREHMRRTSGIANELLASQEGLRSTDSVS
jgi:hypothetical protein